MIPHNNFAPSVPQAQSRDRLLGEGYRVEGIREFPTKLKRTPVERCLVMALHSHKPGLYSCRTVLVNPKGGVE